MQYAVVKPANSYRGSVFWRVGVVDLVVLACVLSATTKKGQLFVLLPKYFLLEPPVNRNVWNCTLDTVSNKPSRSVSECNMEQPVSLSLSLVGNVEQMATYRTWSECRRRAAEYEQEPASSSSSFGQTLQSRCY